MAKQTSRQLKVYGFNRSSSKKAVPQLILSGIWIEQLGFQIGERVTITTRDRLLIIEPVEGEAKAATNYQAAFQEVKQTLKKLIK